VNFGPVTLEFKIGKNVVHPSSINSLATFAWRRQC